MEHSTLLFTLACSFGFFMAWGVGANDVANGMGIAVGSKSLTLRQAVGMAVIFEFLGAMTVGGQVTDTIRGGIINAASVDGMPELLILGMLSSLLATGIWLIIASYFSCPVSTTHTLVGAIIGFALIRLGADAVYWHNITNIALSWVLTPAIACGIAYSLFRSVQYFVLNAPDPVDAAKKFVPVYLFIAALVITMVTFTRGLAHLGWHFSFTKNLLCASTMSLIITAVGTWMLHRLHLTPRRNPRFDFQNVESIFSILMIFTGCAMAFAHGSNDVANAIGPLAAIVNILASHGEMAEASAAEIPFWVMTLGAVGIVAGLLMYGYKIIATVGTEITDFTPSRGFAATLATASTVVVASGTGLPISTTQTLVGAILGVGLARGIAALRIEVLRNIFLSWLITLPVGALLSIIIFYVLEAFLGK